MTKRRNLSRRGFALIAGAGLAGLLRAQNKIPVAVQLYSVRTLCAADLPSTIAGVAKLGYQAVEFAGYYGHTAAELRKMLDDNGLKCCGTHVHIDALLGDTLQKTIEFNKVIGNPTLIVPGLPKNYIASRAAWKQTAQVFNQISEKAEAQGMRVGYHNHTAEFQSLEGEKPFDIFFGNTRKEVVMQLDIGHAVGGGADPITLLKRYPGRAKSVHVKESSATKHDALIGDGDVKWRDVLTACETVGGTEWYIIEEETGAYPGLEGIAQSLKRLHALGR
ncbi:MAG: sugar phosphate isomerase/epimerase family protein [Bryobacteraceae bacterium]